MKCKHGLKAGACKFCIAPPVKAETLRRVAPLANRINPDQRSGAIKTFASASHPNKSEKNLGGRFDKVSSRPTCITDFSAEARMERDGVEKVFNQIMARIGPKKYERR